MIDFRTFRFAAILVGLSCLSSGFAQPLDFDLDDPLPVDRFIHDFDF